MRRMRTTTITCSECGEPIKYSERERHMTEKHRKRRYHCPFPDSHKNYERAFSLRDHMHQKHKMSISLSESEWKLYSPLLFPLVVEKLQALYPGAEIPEIVRETKVNPSATMPTTSWQVVQPLSTPPMSYAFVTSLLTLPAEIRTILADFFDHLAELLCSSVTSNPPLIPPRPNLPPLIPLRRNPPPIPPAKTSHHPSQPTKQQPNAVA